VAAYSSHGGAGVTTFITNLAISIKKMGEVRVCLMDLDLQNGDVPVFLNFKHPYSILDLTENAGSLDPTFLQGTLFHHSSGLDILAPPPMLEDGESISARDVSHIIDALKSHFDYILVDTSSALNDITFAVIEKADRCFLLTDNMVPSVRAMQRVANTLDRLGVGHGTLGLVLSRPVEKSDITSQDIRDVVKLDVTYTLPRDDATAIQAANRGVPAYEVNPKSPLVAAIEAIARSVTGVTSASTSKGSGLFGRFFSESRV
jgi:pilus assembly protein CpaE